MRTNQIKLFDGNIATVRDTDNYKALKSKDYNFFFNKKDGYFVRWGKGDYSLVVDKITKQEMDLFILWSNIWKEKFNIKEFVADLKTDSNYNNMIPDILDFEVSTKCSYGCSFCYKSNNQNGDYISTENFTKIIDKLPISVCQCALGLGNVDQPNLFELMDVLINKDIVPNVTINGARLTTYILDNLAKRCGAIAVSHYNSDLTFNAVHELATIRGMKQINIHAFLSEESYSKCLSLIDSIQTDDRLKNLNAVVFLSMKKKGNALKNNYQSLSKEKFDYLSNLLLEKNIAFGWDSCSCQNFIRSVENRPDREKLIQYSDPCEASIASSYISMDGIYYPCSFCEGIEYAPGDWRNGISVLNCDDFLKDVWYHQKTRMFATDNIKCRNNCISCPVFDI